MPRSNRPRNAKKAEPVELNLALIKTGFRKTEIKRGTEYTVQSTTGLNSEDDKSWVCPHCQIQIAKGTAHLVAWDTIRGVETRRHFHSNCWKAFQGVLL
ncbi:hypothetical protein A4Z71_02445 [Candidatus Rhodoluna planktonica]|uniref:ATP/GTP-binding protein n=1 Tax=Candidatus Rhodoluna planktonica TaxID=535712 RepID=A0A1D9DYJ4_9MICO|nr:hypothetical protein A4Z71_02445 [Candidatus Rhodoluna planktonica]